VIDTVPPPAPAIDSGPSGLVNSATASFTFSDAEAGTTFECKLDGGSYVACTSPKSYSSLAEGSHTFYVRAKDAAGNLSTAGSQAWTVDTTPPPTPSIDSKPANPSNDASPSFGFSDSEGGVSFLCERDGSGFSACTSPKSYSSLTDGSHIFKVKAKDAAGNESSAASYTWTIDTTPPPTPSIGTKPANPSNNASPSFGFSDSEPGVDFLCERDGDGFSACTSPKSYSSLTDGSHTFKVKAKDAAGNESSAATYTWTIDTVAPNLTVPADIVKTATSTAGTVVNYSVSATDDVDPSPTIACKVGGTPAPVSGSVFLGTYTIDCTATDSAGNTSIKSFKIIVTFSFNGFLQPVDNKILNGMKAGSTAPMKWQVLNPSGGYISDLAIVKTETSNVIACIGGTPDPLEEYATGGTSLRYDSTNNQFVYNWQSPRKAGNCYIVNIVLTDGTTHSATFQLN
jgi:hypothetical protein